jgi:hypothetical protein
VCSLYTPTTGVGENIYNGSKVVTQSFYSKADVDR